MKYVTEKNECLEAIRNNMLKNGCSEEHIKMAQENHLELRETQKVTIAVL